MFKKLPFADIITFFKKPTNVYLEDDVDLLSSWIGTTLMLLFCTISTAGLMVGNNFECAFPMNYKDGDWNKFVQGYCYVQPHYSTEVNGYSAPSIYLFPWLPYLFFGHAAAFLLPKLLCRVMASVFGIELEATLKEVDTIEQCKTDKDREAKKKALTSYMTRRIASRGQAPAYFLQSFTAFMFLFKKYFYVVMAYIQFSAICHYIGEGNMYWGLEVLSHTFTRQGYRPSRLFPLFTFCEANILQDNQMQNKTASCVLGMNVLYEMLYVAVYFFLMVVIICSLVSALYYTYLFLSSMRYHVVDEMLGFKNSNVPSSLVEKFTRDYLRADGVIALLLVQNKFGNETARNLAKSLWDAAPKAIEPSSPMPSPPPLYKINSNYKPNQSIYSLPPHYTTLPSTP